MANKAEISWRRVTEDNVKIQVFARRVGSEWKFFQRQRRFDQWQQIENPPLEDWLELLDSIRRRITRMLQTPAEEERVMHAIRSRYPEWKDEEPT